ncbi:glycosyltransferase family A protein [Tuwongella immobilis]|uniref:2OG-Fe(II) oxygenase n=1 Tax=Tuwongella immobilis TaxID=692036 RepID=A0A6C2YRJ7_9BACT|nr:glycosyltransferase family A protein [Tuwongella immobilis]VIP03981.1 2OG-Fe(II) oxygenase OS=Pseudoalteromonas rubra ATCC 29570 GN=PRUB_07915 PE=4 SV=1 [Tuwongella immobilis]VTS05329.1 2OG-Fe(II) oxygenase OS=Pseudoalteromonas rubra ATCC 29570 GN=PRUB_07915 PE=4 SV=1 [Tuwongella immobilis]
MRNVICVCPTFGRAMSHLHLLEEAVGCFAEQDYEGPKKLVIINDAPGQTLVCSVPNVEIINVPFRFKNLGDKYNHAIATTNFGPQSSGDDVILPWEDDDLALPHRIRQAVEKLEEAGGYDYWNPQRSFFLDHRGLHTDHTHGVCHNASAFTRHGWQKVGGYPQTTGDQDAKMDRLLKQRTRYNPITLPNDPTTWSYVYRWGVSPNHLSSVHPHQSYWDRLATMNYFRGEVQIQPKKPSAFRW